MANPLFTPVIVGGLTTAITTFIQGRSDKMKKAREHRAEELKRADKVYRELTDLLTSFSAYNKESMFGLVFGRISQNWDKPHTPEDEKAWAEYQTVLMDWKKTKSRRLTELKKLFPVPEVEFPEEQPPFKGPLAFYLLSKIEQDFATMEDQIAATYFQRSGSGHFLEDKKDSKNDFRTKYFSVQERAEENISKLSELMVDAIVAITAV